MLWKNWEFIKITSFLGLLRQVAQGKSFVIQMTYLDVSSEDVHGSNSSNWNYKIIHQKKKKKLYKDKIEQN